VEQIDCPCGVKIVRPEGASFSICGKCLRKFDAQKQEIK
jgi:hypothetical protein